MRIRGWIVKPNFICIIFFAATILKFQNHSSWFAFVVAICTIIVILKTGAEAFRQTLHVMKKNIYIIGALFIAVFSTLLNQIISKTYKFNYVFEIIIFGLLTFMGVLLFKKYGKKYVFEGLKQICLVLGIVCVYGIIEFVSKKNIFVQMGLFDGKLIASNMNPNHRIATIFIHPIVYGNILLCILFFSLFMLKKHTKYVLSFFSFVNILLTQSRSSWFALGSVLLLMFVRSDFFRKGKILQSRIVKFMLLVVVIILVMFLSPAGDMIIRRFSNFLDYFSEDYQRTGSIYFIINRFLSNGPLKILFGAGGHASAETMLSTTIQWSDFTTTDNLYLADLFNFGIIYVVVVLLQLVKMIRNFYNNRDCFSNFVWSTLISFEVCFFFYEPFNFYPVATLFFMLFGIALGHENEQRKCWRQKTVS